MRAVIWLIENIISLYIFLLIVQAVLSWLVAFNVVNSYNKFVSVVGEVTYKLTEPLLRPIRSVLPQIGGLDVSPIVLILLLQFLRLLILDNADLLL
jgi:YggT family protein